MKKGTLILLIYLTIFQQVIIVVNMEIVIEREQFQSINVCAIRGSLELLMHMDQMQSGDYFLSKSNYFLIVLMVLVHSSVFTHQALSASSYGNDWMSLLMFALDCSIVSIDFINVINIQMDRFQNVKQVWSPTSSNLQSNNSQLVFGTPSDSYIRQSQIIDSSKSIYRNVNSLSQQRLQQIAKGFISKYTHENYLSRQNALSIQNEAHIHSNLKCNNETAQLLLDTMDQNRDKKVGEDDILNLCRRYLSFDKRQIIYTPIVQERLAVARRLFKQFDVDKKGYLTEKQVPNLLKETYRTLGKTFHATEEDVKSWMRLADGDGDGIVTLNEYEKSIIRALKKQGVKIYEQ